MTLREVLKRYAVMQDLSERTVVLYGHTLDRFRDHLGHEPTLNDIDDMVVAGFLRWRAVTPHRGRKPSAASVAKDKCQITAIANWAAKKRLERSDGRAVEFLSLPRSRKIRHAPQAYTVEEVSRLIQRAGRRQGDIGGQPAAWFWQTLIRAAWETAERIGALLAIKWADVDADAKCLLFRAETRKGRSEDLQRGISDALAEQLRGHAREPGERVWNWDREHTSLWPSMRILCKQAGVRGTGFHKLRKASASYVALAGGDATEHLGHASPDITRQHYLDPRITAPKRAVDYLPPLDLGEPEQAGSDEGKDENPAAATRRPA